MEGTILQSVEGIMVNENLEWALIGKQMPYMFKDLFQMFRVTTHRQAHLGPYT
jgi:hypothetical protein